MLAHDIEQDIIRLNQEINKHSANNESFQINLKPIKSKKLVSYITSKSCRKSRRLPLHVVKSNPPVQYITHAPPVEMPSGQIELPLITTKFPVVGKNLPTIPSWVSSNKNVSPKLCKQQPMTPPTAPSPFKTNAPQRDPSLHFYCNQETAAPHDSNRISTSSEMLFSSFELQDEASDISEHEMYKVSEPFREITSKKIDYVLRNNKLVQVSASPRDVNVENLNDCVFRKSQDLIESIHKNNTMYREALNISPRGRIASNV